MTVNMMGLLIIKSGFFLDISKKTQAKKTQAPQKTQAQILPKTQGTGGFML